MKCKSYDSPCVRYRIAETSLYREQEAPYWIFSQRWKRMELVDITKWASDEIRTIEISLAALHAPYQTKVRQFIPEPGDMMAKRWIKDGQTIHYPLPAYAFANMEETATAIGQMIEREVGNYICAMIGAQPMADSLIWNTYFAAFKRAHTSPVIADFA